jgi:hypothetical protein
MVRASDDHRNHGCVVGAVFFHVWIMEFAAFILSIDKAKSSIFAMIRCNAIAPNRIGSSSARGATRQVRRSRGSEKLTGPDQKKLTEPDQKKLTGRIRKN